MSSMKQEQMLRLTGNQSTSELMASVTKLKQELSVCQSEKQRLTDQLNCLISLVKRAWNGDKGASIHLANIIGQTANPDPGNGETRRLVNTPIQFQFKTQVVRHWERLAIKLLEREYTKIQQEIQERQLNHLRSRELYIEEILRSHGDEMAGYTLHRQKSLVQEVDKKFVENYSKKKVRPHSAIHRPASSSNLMQRRKLHGNQDPGDSELTFADLFIHSSENQSSNTVDTNKALNGLYKMDTEDKDRRVDRRGYSDSSRYAQQKLYDATSVFGAEKTNKQRPVSAVLQRERDKMRARPKSAVFLTQKNERPLKYETTKPVSAKHIPSSRSIPSRLYKEHRPDNEHQKTTEDEDREEHCKGDNHTKTENTRDEPEGSEKRQKSTLIVDPATKKVDSVETLIEDMKKMNDMEEEFKKTTFQLQKKIGISSHGLVY